MKLLELQRRMAADLMRPLTLADNLSPKSKADEYISPNEQLSSRERLEIYSRSYWYRLLDSLYDDFPGLRAIIGDDVFHRLSRAYLAAHPSKSFTMRDLGADLEQWVRRRHQYTAGHHELALDMVRLEWAHIIAFDSPPAKLLDPEDLLELGPELRMNLQPYLSLVQVRHAVDDLRVRISRQADLHDTASNAPAAPKRRATRTRTLKREPSPLYIAVHRFDDMVYYRRLAPEAFRILTSLHSGDPIGIAIEKGFEGSTLTADDYQASIGKWFAIWAELGWLCRP
jgi:hypothetical protein